MLDAYIIDRLQREQEERQRIPLHAHLPRIDPKEVDPKEVDPKDNPRGAQIIDFTI